MSVLVAPDKFKGTLSAAEVAAAIARGLEAGGIGDVVRLPVADGGEGTIEALVAARGGELRTAIAGDPLGRPVEARFALLEPGDVAVVELAEASGLWRLNPAELDAEAATTRGTGELIAVAIAAGARELLVAVGGSATTDGGRGALEALGARFEPEVELAPLREALGGVRITVLCDVENPLCGPDGAARVFSPQKGADPDAVARLEARLERWAELADEATGRDPAGLPRAGAAGGFAAGFWAFAAAELAGGAGRVLDEIGFDRTLAGARAAITGEGKLDRQTLEGKAVAEVARRCRVAGVPAFAIAGRVELDARELAELGVSAREAAPAGKRADDAAIAACAERLADELPSAPSRSAT